MSKMNKFDENFQKVSMELEKFCDNFLIEGVPEDYKGVWLPKNEVRAWAIPRKSAEILKLLVLANKSKVVLELGTSFGYSAIWLASAVKEFNGKVHTVDLIKPKIKEAKKNFKRARVEKFINQIEGEISQVLNKWNKKIDFVFLDADKPNYLNYIKKMEPHFKRGTVIVADNATDFGYAMKDYLEYISKDPKYRSYLLDIDHGLMISVKI